MAAVVVVVVLWASVAELGLVGARRLPPPSSLRDPRWRGGKQRLAADGENRGVQRRRKRRERKMGRHPKETEGGEEWMTG